MLILTLPVKGEFPELGFSFGWVGGSVEQTPVHGHRENFVQQMEFHSFASVVAWHKSVLSCIFAIDMAQPSSPSDIDNDISMMISDQILSFSEALASTQNEIIGM